MKHRQNDGPGRSKASRLSVLKNLAGSKVGVGEVFASDSNAVKIPKKNEDKNIFSLFVLGTNFYHY